MGIVFLLKAVWDLIIPYTTNGVMKMVATLSPEYHPSDVAQSLS